MKTEGTLSEQVKGEWKTYIVSEMDGHVNDVEVKQDIARLGGSGQ